MGERPVPWVQLWIKACVCACGSSLNVPPTPHKKAKCFVERPNPFISFHFLIFVSEVMWFLKSLKRSSFWFGAHDRHFISLFSDTSQVNMYRSRKQGQIASPGSVGHFQENYLLLFTSWFEFLCSRPLFRQLFLNLGKSQLLWGWWGGRGGSKVGTQLASISILFALLP